jgi:hypothetical protein
MVSDCQPQGCNHRAPRAEFGSISTAAGADRSDPHRDARSKFIAIAKPYTVTLRHRYSDTCSGCCRCDTGRVANAACVALAIRVGNPFNKTLAVANAVERARQQANSRFGSDVGRAVVRNLDTRRDSPFVRFGVRVSATKNCLNRPALR